MAREPSKAEWVNLTRAINDMNRSTIKLAKATETLNNTLIDLGRLIKDKEDINERKN